MGLPCSKPITTYTPRNPKASLLHQIVSKHWHEYRYHIEEKTSKPLAKYVVEEFEEFLKCGDLEHGFLRLTCDTVLDDDEVDENIKPGRLARDSKWAKLLKKTFQIDVSTCNVCGSELRIVAAIMKKEEIKRYLDHTGLWQNAPPDPKSPSILADNNITYEPID